jgi:hypothetical protein
LLAATPALLFDGRAGSLDGSLAWPFGVSTP